MAFPPAFLEEIRDRVSLVSAIGRRVRLVRKGHEWQGLCPFHNEKSPSFTVNEDKGFFHCFAGETLVATPDGDVPIIALAGRTVKVLAPDGHWISAPFKSYGTQRLYRIELSRNGVRKTLHATSGHRWFVRGRESAVTTVELRKGHRLSSVVPEPRGDWTLDPSGIRHGIVFGDGTVQSKGTARYGTVNLHGEKAEDLAPRFDGYEPGSRTRESGQEYLRAYGGSDFGHMKSLPPADAPDSYLLGFLAGYLATDGHVAKDGTVMLHSRQAADLAWVRTAAQRLGIGTFSVTEQMRRGYLDEEQPIHRIHFMSASLSAQIFLRREARERFVQSRKKFQRLRWAVISVEETERIEEVFCAEVPEHHAFALADNILTGNCFGCGAHGDVIGFEMRAGNLSFPEAVEKLSGEAGLEMPRERPEDRVREQRAATLHQACEAAARFFEAELFKPAGRAGLEYLRGRGLDDETIARFRLGFAPDSRVALRRALNAAGVKDDLAIEAGLLIQPEGNGDPYDRFRGRVMFPIGDRRGRVIAFGGRTLGDGQPKYLNSPETPLFHKGEVLYGLALAREPAALAGTLVVCEGYMDVIALHRAGFAHAVAPLGTAVTEAQIALLWRFTQTPIICLDGDKAGIKAAGRVVERALPMLKPGFSLKFAFVPAPEDPDSLIRQRGAKAMAEVLEQARPLSDILWDWAVAGGHLATPETRAALDRYIEEKIQDSAVRAEYLREFRNRRYELSRRPASQRSPAGAARRGGNKRDTARATTVANAILPPPASATARAEQLVLAALVIHPGFLDAFEEALGHLEFGDSELDGLRQTLVAHATEWCGLDSGAVRSHLSNAGFASLLDRLLARPFAEHFVRPDAPAGKVRLGLKWELRLLGGQIDAEAMENELVELERSEGV